MKIIKILFTMTLLIIISTVLNDKAHAHDNSIDYLVEQENTTVEQMSTSIRGYTTVVVPRENQLPSRVWFTKGAYSGYLPLDTYELSPSKNWVGHYRGNLYLNVAPNKYEETEL